ncbi:hypothetical protein GLYMA_07G132250v4 [Glycine max]|nr:hypothetical protein GLYMA_07G132250v4 [Glycine max]KAH1086694.1 hypothetical protein GYH30_018271 [Glycine max]
MVSICLSIIWPLLECPLNYPSVEWVDVAKEMDFFFQFELSRKFVELLI